MTLAVRPADTPLGHPQLIYVTDAEPGFRRVEGSDGVSYVRQDGRPLRDAQQLERIRKLAIPPAYTDVWICPHPLGHLQATGKDARGRKQYRYHAAWRVARDAGKFEHMLAFGAALPRIRRRVARDLAVPVGSQLQQSQVLAALVRLLDTTLVRIGNDVYAKANKSFGLTTLRNRHAEVHGTRLQLHFRGKSGVMQQVELQDPRVARIVRRCQAMPGQELFQYRDATGDMHRVTSSDVNDYLRTASGGAFTAKDFRTWHASVHALTLLLDVPDGDVATLSARRRSANEVLAEVAARLGNTVAVCRKSYVHPQVLEAALHGLPDAMTSPEPTRPKRTVAHGITAEERRLLAFLARTERTKASSLRSHRGARSASVSERVGAPIATASVRSE